MTTIDDDAGASARPETRAERSRREPRTTRSAPLAKLVRIAKPTGLPAPPLWLLGIIEAIQIALITVLAVLLPVMAMAWADGFVSVDAGFVTALSAQVWSVMHGAPVLLQVTVESGALGEGVALPEGGWFQMLPMGLALVPLLLARRCGARLARGAYSGQLWQGLISLVLTYAAAGAGIGLLARTPGFVVEWSLTLVCALLICTVGALAGAYSEARSWERLVGVDIEGRVERWSQSMRWAGSYAWAVCRAGAVAAGAAFGLAALLLGAQIGLRWMDIANMFQQLDPGIWGVIGLTLLHLALLPNLILWTLAYSSGAGFAVGGGTVIAPYAVHVGPMPAVPVLGALPGAPGQWSMLVVLLPVLAGAAAGWWLVREGENHLDDWFSLRIPLRPVSLALSTLLLGLFTGLAAAVVIVVPLALSHISLGMGRMTDLGPHALLAAGMLGVWVALGTMIGYLVAPAADQVRRRRRASTTTRSAEVSESPQAETESSATREADPAADSEVDAVADADPEADSETLTATAASTCSPSTAAPRPRAKDARRSAPASIDEVFGVRPHR